MHWTNYKASVKNIHTTLHIPSMSVSDVHKALTQLKPSGTTGPDNIGKILKLLAPATAERLTYLYNLCIEKSHFPTLLNPAIVMPLYKSGGVDDPAINQSSSSHHFLNPWRKHVDTHLRLHWPKHQLLQINLNFNI